MNPEQKIADLEAKLDKVYASIEKTRKYFLWTMVITVAVLVLPLIGLAFAIPLFLNQLNAIANIGF